MLVAYFETQYSSDITPDSAVNAANFDTIKGDFQLQMTLQLALTFHSHLV